MTATADPAAPEADAGMPAEAAPSTLTTASKAAVADQSGTAAVSAASSAVTDDVSAEGGAADSDDPGRAATPAVNVAPAAVVVVSTDVPASEMLAEAPAKQSSITPAEAPAEPKSAPPISEPEPDAKPAVADAAAKPSTPVKALPAAAVGAPETPALVRNMTGVAEGFDPKTPQPAAERSVAAVVAASLADAAPLPADEAEYSTFQEAVGEEVKMAKAASDAAQALGSPDAADDILKQMAADLKPSTPTPAVVAATAAKSGGEQGAHDSAKGMAALDAAAASVGEAPTGGSADALVKGGPKEAQAVPEEASPTGASPAEAATAAPPAEAAPAAAEGTGSVPEVAAMADSPAEAVAALKSPSSGGAPLAELPVVPEEQAGAADSTAPAKPAALQDTAAKAEPEPAAATTEPLADSLAAGSAVAADSAVTVGGSAAAVQAEQPAAATALELSTPSAASRKAAVREVLSTTPPATPEPALNGIPESPQTPEHTRTPSGGVAARIASLKTGSEPVARSTLVDVPVSEDGSSTSGSSVKERLAAFRRNSETLSADSPSIRRPSPMVTPMRRWSVNTTPSPMSPAGPPATGEVVAEAAKPKTELKSFWEARRPVGIEKPSTPTKRTTADSSSPARKWHVKLNVPLASGKVSDLSYYKKPVESEPPPPPEYTHRVGVATFPLEQLKGMTGEDGIDPANKELYLADDEFLSTFEIDKETYQSKPKWRQVLLKKKAGLF